MSPAAFTVDDAVARLVAAYAAAGLPAIRPAANDIDRVLAAIEREIAPLRLDKELARFWQLVDPATITVAPYPRLTTAEFALDCWTSHRDDLGTTPYLLFPVAYESHGFLLVELDDGAGPSGAVFEWGYAGSPFYVRFPSLSGYLDLLATMIELGEFTRHERPTHSWIEFAQQSWEDAQSVRLAAAQPLPRIGSTREFDEDPRHWPDHWLVANGLTADVRTPRGANTTIAQLLQKVRTGAAASGTIRATVTSLWGSADGCRVSADDGTGILDLWCPAAVCTYGPSMRSTFEFDVAVQANAAAPPDASAESREIQERALAYDIEGAQAAAVGMHAVFSQYKAGAEAKAIRPLD